MSVTFFPTTFGVVVPPGDWDAGPRETTFKADSSSLTVQSVFLVNRAAWSAVGVKL
jgi:hypothetical protein